MTETQRKYPDSEERAHIIARRNQLHRDLIEYLVTRSPDEQEAREQFNPLAREYGFDEVYRMLQKISPLLNRPKDPDVEDVYLYNQYVEIYRRFGGDRPFLSLPEYHRLNYERAMLLAGPILQDQQLSQKEQQRLDELSDMLLSEPYLWDDLVPENPPKTLAKEQGALPVRKVGRNQPCPCGSGKKYKKCCLAKDEAAARQAYAERAEAQREVARAFEPPLPEPPSLAELPPLPPPNPLEQARGELWEEFEAADSAEQRAAALNDLRKLVSDAAPIWEQRTADPAVGPNIRLAWEHA